MIAAIHIGASVVFQNVHGWQSGTIHNIKRDVSNGQPYAIVELNGPSFPPGSLESVALADVQLAGAP